MFGSTALGSQPLGVTQSGSSGLIFSPGAIPLALTAHAPLATLPGYVVGSAVPLSLSEQAPTYYLIYTVPACPLSLTAKALRNYQSFPPLVQKTPLFLCDLTGDADATTDLRLAIASFQSRRVSGAPSTLSVVVPSIAQAEEIETRLNGDIVVYFGYRNETTGAVLVSEIARANLEDVRTDQGGRNQSITLRGTKQQTFSSPVSRTLTGVTYRAVIEGKIRFRTDMDTELRPGDTALVNNESIVVDTITYVVGRSLRTMEVSE